MQLKNSIDRYGFISIAFHWVMALIVIGLIILGLYMTTLSTSLLKLKLYGWHKQFGILVLILAILRVYWRFISITPSLSSLKPWERGIALLVHWAFYILMIALPLTGWLMSSASGISVSFFGWFVLPNLIPADKANRILFATMHEWIAYLLIGMICLHILAALKHHFIDKDDILKRMVS